MFTVRCGAINNLSKTYPLHELDPSGECVLINCSLHTAINSAGDLSFTMLPNHPYYDKVDKKMYTFVDVMEDNDVIWRGRVTGIQKDIYAQKNVSCEGCMSFLADTIQRPKRYKKEPIRDFFLDVIANHNAMVRHTAKKITLGSITKATNAKISGVVDYETTLEAIGRLVVNKYGGFIEIEPTASGLKLNYKGTFEKNASQKIELGENLMDFRIDQNSLDVYTAIIPLGAIPEGASSEIDNRLTIESVHGGQDYIYKDHDGDTYINDYGWIFKVIENSDIDNAQELMDWGRDQLDEMNWDKFVLEIGAVDLSLINPNLKALQLGQKVNVVSELHGINVTMPITEMTMNISTPEASRYVIGLRQSTKLTGLQR